jgi:hypothetical protein
MQFFLFAKKDRQLSSRHKKKYADEQHEHTQKERRHKQEALPLKIIKEIFP